MVDTVAIYMIADHGTVIYCIPLMIICLIYMLEMLLIVLLSNNGIVL